MSERPHLDDLIAMAQQVFAEAILDAVEGPLIPDAPNPTYRLRLTQPTMAVLVKLYTTLPNPTTPGKESYVLRILTSETGVPVPRVLHFDPSQTQRPYAWALYTDLPGQPLADLLDTLPPPDQEGIGYEVGRYLARIHAIPLERYGEFFPPTEEPAGEPSEKGYIVSRAADLLEAIEAEAILPLELINTLRSWYLSTTVLDRKAACLIHGRYTPACVFVEAGAVGYHVTGVMEFEHARGGSPEEDMAFLFEHTFQNRPALEKGFLDGYADAGELGATFWDRLRLYRMLVALERLTHAHRNNNEDELKAAQRRINALATEAGLI